MYVTFTCKRSGNSVKFKNEADIVAMRKEPGYEEVKGEAVVPVPALPEKITKHRGRPRKGI